jgi:hypothetical protein
VLSRRWLINCALVITIISLAWFGYKVDKTADEQVQAGISALKPADVQTIRLLSGEQRLELQRDADSWQITHPVRWPAQASNVERLLSILRLEASKVADAADIDRAALGLQPPAASWRLNDTQLLFGAVNNIGERRYLLVDGRLYLLPDVHLAFSGQGLAGMVDRRLVPHRAGIASLKLPAGEATRDAEQAWRWSSDPRVTAYQAQQLVDNWRSLSANGIRAFRLDAAPGEVIEVRLEDGTEIDFLLQSSAPEIVIANPQIGLQYHFRRDYYDQLIAPGDDG